MAIKRNPQDLIISAFDDYVAARFLLLNKYSLNGVILASMCVEKYLKAMLAVLNVEFKNLHLDRIDEIRSLFANTEYNVIFHYIDPRFLDLLSLGYKFRYYDNVKEKTTIGFATHQVLGELDHFISVLEQLTVMLVNGKKVPTPYQRAVSNSDIRVFDSNYIVNKIDRQTYYEQETYCFGLHIDPERSGPLSIKGDRIKPPYNGQLTQITLEYKDETN
jgi:HEPN domain-containing protein